jgi:hypothetical protein
VFVAACIANPFVAKLREVIGSGPNA